MFQVFAGNGEPGGDRERYPQRKHVTYSFCDVRDVLDVVDLRVSRPKQYTYSTRESSRALNPTQPFASTRTVRNSLKLLASCRAIRHLAALSALLAPHSASFGGAR